MKNFFVRYKSPMAVMMVLIIAGGVFVYGRMQTSLFPDITFPKIKVIADAGLQPVDKMMITVTKPLENAIKQVPDLQLIRSTTSKGTCEISAYMNWNADIDLGQQRLESKISQIRNQLPAETQITIERMNPSILPVMGYTLESHVKSPIELRMLANYTIRPFLSQVAGVAEVRVIGGKAKEYWAVLDQSKMTRLSITPEVISSALAQTNFIKSNGYVSGFDRMYLSVTDASVHSLGDLQDIVVANDRSRIVRLHDVAEVQVQEAVEYTRINANGHEGLLIAVIKQPNANLIDVSGAMKKQIAGLKRMLPSGVTIQPYYVQADFVNDAVRSVSDSLWVGLLLAIVVSMIFLRSWKGSITILITIPITLSLTLLVLYALGYSLNIMTLGAIAAAIGLIIDDAIVVVEQIQRTHEEHPLERTENLLQKSIHHIFPAMVGSSVSTIVIFIPFVLMSGVAGAYFKILTNTMLITLACSFFVTWLALPVVYLLTGNFKHRSADADGGRAVRRQRWVSFLITRPWVSIILVVLLASVIAIVLPQIETGFLPEMDEGSIVLDYASPPGTSLEETDRMLREVENKIQKVPEVAAYSRRTGTEMGFFITEPNSGDYLIQLKTDRSRTTEEVISDIRSSVESSQPALRVDFGQVIGDMLGDLMTSVQPIEIKIFGDDQQRLRDLSTQVADLISGVAGTADVFNGIVIAGPSVSVIPQYSRLAQFGITPASFQMQIQNAMEGNIAGYVQEKEQMTPLRMLYPNSRKMSVRRIDSLDIFLPDGKLIPITSLAAIRLNAGDAEIKRENLQSMGVVTARLENRDLGSVMKDIRAKIDAQISLPSGYHISYGGAYAEQGQSFTELLTILITAGLLVFGVILFLFREVRLALLVLALAALGTSGSLLALYLTHTPLNVGSYTGMIMIVGIIGENAIFTINQFQSSLSTMTTRESIVYSISTRLRPKLMTALGAIAALMPLALGIGVGAQLHQPLAISVIGGFVIAMPLLLVALPSFLAVLYKNGPASIQSKNKITTT